MAYRGRALGRAPPPPPPPPSSSSISSKKMASTLLAETSSQHHFPCDTESTRFMAVNEVNQKNRSRSISNLSQSNHSTDSSHSATSSSANTDGDSTTPHSMSPTSRLLDDFEMNKIEMFYRSHRAFVYVGQCMTSLYFTETELIDGGRRSRPKSQDWKLVCSGVPVLLFNRGDTKSRDKRQVRICLAEHGTGFQLWTDIIDNLSNYQALKPNFHTMYLSDDHRKMAGLNFDNQVAALEFYRQIEIIVANPLNISLTAPKKSTEKFKFFRRGRSKSVGRSSNHHRDLPNKDNNRDLPFFEQELREQSSWKNGGRHRQPKKCDISTPCLFQHVTSVNLGNFIQLAEPAHQHHSTNTISPSLNSESLSHKTIPDYSIPMPFGYDRQSSGTSCGDLRSSSSSTNGTSISTHRSNYSY